MADLSRTQAGKGRKADIFPESAFAYDPAADRYTCPAGQTLRPGRRHERRRSTDYVAPPRACAACALRQRCTRSKTGRSVKRHDRQAVIDAARAETNSRAGRKDRRRRMSLMERSWADGANNHAHSWLAAANKRNELASRWKKF